MTSIGEGNSLGVGDWFANLNNAARLVSKPRQVDIVPHACAPCRPRHPPRAPLGCREAGCPGPSPYACLTKTLYSPPRRLTNGTTLVSGYINSRSRLHIRITPLVTV